MQRGEGTIENTEIDMTGCRNPPCHMKDPMGQQFSTRKRNKQKQAYQCTLAVTIRICDYPWQARVTKISDGATIFLPLREVVGLPYFNLFSTTRNSVFYYNIVLYNGIVVE